MEKQADIAVIGLGVMGQNLILNMNDHGFRVVVYNRTTSKVDDFLNGSAKNTTIQGVHSLEELVASLKSPRKIMFMVKAGNAVDQLVDKLIPLLDEGDILIDGGNANYKDSARVGAYIESKNLLYVGCGVSGGEEGARNGPSIMPGGSEAAWPHIKDIYQSIAAKASDGTPCCDWVGKGAAGHFVKMVHNEIEYGDMQLITEAYDLMHTALNMTSLEISKVFQRWNTGKLDSYLIEITAEVLNCTDEDGTPLVEKILDTAGQKGTGKWTSIASLESGVPLTLIGEAVYSRFLSSLKEERVQASKELSGPSFSVDFDREEFIDDLEHALYASKIISYTQGYMLFRAASGNFKWDLKYGAISMMWREGCIIRAAFLEKIKEAFDEHKNLTNLLLAPYFKEQINASQASWRRIIGKGAAMGVPLPAMSAALNFYDGYRREKLPANLLQAQRDYFGAHTYERIDRPRGEFFHTNWLGK